MVWCSEFHVARLLQSTVLLFEVGIGLLFEVGVPLEGILFEVGVPLEGILFEVGVPLKGRTGVKSVSACVVGSSVQFSVYRT